MSNKKETIFALGAPIFFLVIGFVFASNTLVNRKRVENMNNYEDNVYNMRELSKILYVVPIVGIFFYVTYILLTNRLHQ